MGKAFSKGKVERIDRLHLLIPSPYGHDYYQ